MKNNNRFSKRKFMNQSREILFFLCLMFYSVNTMAQHVVTGKVVDQNQQAIIGASITIKGASQGTISDIDGVFSLNASDKDILRIQYIGYKSTEIPIDGQTSIQIILEEDVAQLEEVVIVGYGVQKKASLTGAITQVKGDATFKDKGLSNPSVALQGEIPGLSVTRSSSRPGSEGVRMQLRGDISVNYDSSPLVIIDGIAGSLDELNQMDSNDIDNISVLKDASAAIYGARSASGVLLVTTKRGSQGKPKISYSGSLSTTLDGIRTPLTTLPEWLDMFYDAQYQDAKASNPGATDEEVERAIDWWVFAGDPLAGDVYSGKDLFDALRRGEVFTQKQMGGNWVARYDPTDLMSTMYGRANSQKHSINISGADEKFSYMASLGFADNNSQLQVAEDGEKKYSGRLNADFQANRYLKFETGMSYEVRNITTPNTDIGAGYFDPWFWPVYNEEGQFYDTFSGLRNPIGGLVGGGQNKTDFNTTRMNMKVIYDVSKLLPGLSLSASGAYKKVEKNIQEFKKSIQYYDWNGNPTGLRDNGVSEGASLKETYNTWTGTTLGGFADYSTTFLKDHSISAMIGLTAEQEDWKRIHTGRQKGLLYPDSDLVDLNVLGGGDNNISDGGQSSWGFVSVVSRLNYNFSDRYLVELLGRRDGSSKLSLEQQWKNFYAISGAWVLTGEEFMKSADWLDNLKLRYNYGKTGNVSGIGNYERYATISTGSAYFGNAMQTSLWLSGMTSSQRTWEVIHSHNVGLDYALLRSRLYGSFDWFDKINTGMFIPVQYPSILGASAPKTNNGKFQAKGWEFAINWRDKVGSLKYDVGFWLSDAKSTILHLQNNENVPLPGKNSDRLIGMPRNAFYVFETAGLFQTQEEADAYYDQYYWNEDHSGPKEGNIIPPPITSGSNRLRPGTRIVVDRNGDGAITNDDIYYAGDAAPHYLFGFKTRMEWKGIDLQAFFQGVWKQTVMRSGYFAYPWATHYMLLNRSFYGKTWSEDNPNTEYAVASRNADFKSWNYINKDVLIQDSRYVRLKTLVVGYSLPQSVIKKASIEKVRVYFSGDDLWEATKIKDGYDPEHGESSNNTFPFSRLISVGVDITF